MVQLNVLLCSVGVHVVSEGVHVVSELCEVCGVSRRGR